MRLWIRRPRLVASGLGLALVVPGCRAVPKQELHPETLPKPKPIITPAAPPTQKAPLPEGYVLTGKLYRGKASWYSVSTNHGTTTASGQRLQNDAFTAAHPSLPFDTRVRVTNLRNGRSAVVRITDRGPFIKGRIIDITIGAARAIGMVKAGVVPCTVEVLERSP